MVSHLLYVDSKERTAGYPHVNDFVIDIAERFENVEKIELLSIVLPTNGGDIYQQGSLLVSLTPQNLNRIKMSKMSNLPSVALVLCPSNPPTTGTIFATISERQLVDLNTTMNIQTRFGMTFYTTDGQKYDFGETAGDVTNQKNIKALFKIYCKDEI